MGYLYKTIGLLFLFLAKLKYILKSYSSPRPFSDSEINKAITYDINVADHWLEYLCRYSVNKIDILDKVILELGPGPDLGIGLYLLSKGALEYYAFDKYALATKQNSLLYDALYQKIKDSNNSSRSEEHTSELQSHSFISYAVFCSKKKTKTI